MSKLPRSNAWQRARAAKLHEHFKAIAVHVAGGAKIGEQLERAAGMLNGRLLTFPGGQHVLKATPKTLRREWDKWRKGTAQAAACTADALLLNFKPGCNGCNKLPSKLVAEIHRRASAQTGGRDKHQKSPLSVVYQSLCKDFEERNPLPGIDYADYPVGSEFPWSYATVCRHKPGKALRLLGNVGVAAAKGAQAYVSMNYTKLRKGELYTLDDVRLDIIVIDELTGRAIEVVIYVLMEVGSRFIVAYIMKPAHAIRAEDVDELLAHGLQTPGFGIGVGYTTHILFERGAVACSESAQLVLEGVTNGGIMVHRTSMNGGVRWTGAPADKASGNAAGKGVIESFNRRLHHALLDLPGQRGNNFGNAPANLGYEGAGKLAPRTLAAEAQALAEFELRHGRRIRLQLGMLRFFELHKAVHEAIERHNHEPGHKYSGHGTFRQEEVQPGVWRDTVAAPDLRVATPDRSHETYPSHEPRPSASARGYTLKLDPVPMTPGQRNAAYWNAWSAVEKVQPTLSRHAVTHRVLGRVIPLKEMTDDQFAKILRAFDKITKKGANR